MSEIDNTVAETLTCPIPSTAPGHACLKDTHLEILQIAYGNNITEQTNLASMNRISHRPYHVPGADVSFCRETVRTELERIKTNNMTMYADSRFTSKFNDRGIHSSAQLERFLDSKRILYELQSKQYDLGCTQTSSAEWDKFAATWASSPPTQESLRSNHSKWSELLMSDACTYLLS